MKPPCLLFAALIVALTAQNHGAEPSPIAPERPIVEPLKISVANKVDAVVWSVQPAHCTVQIIFPSVLRGQKQPAHSRIEVWLLKADGTCIPRQQRLEGFWISNAGFDTASMSYSFPLSARTEAIAVVVSIDKQLFVERLTPNRE